MVEWGNEAAGNGEVSQGEADEGESEAGGEALVEVEEDVEEVKVFNVRPELLGEVVENRVSSGEEDGDNEGDG